MSEYMDMWKEAERQVDRLEASIARLKEQSQTKGNYVALQQVRAENIFLRELVAKAAVAFALLSPNKARHIAQNDYMIDQWFLYLGKILNEYARVVEEFRELLETHLQVPSKSEQT